MFEIKRLTENTWYYQAYTNVGIHRINEKEVVLIDACDHPRMVKSLDRLLCEMGLTVNTVIDTHGHIDHICGNKYFKEKYASRILCSRDELPFVLMPDLSPKFYNVGLSVDRLRSPFFNTESVDAEVITPDNLPEGFEVIELPGHSFGMIGVRTPDDVVFLSDAVLSEFTWESHRLPFFHDVNKSFETFEMLRNLKAKLFLPSHCGVIEDISSLASYNLERLREKKRMVYELCENQSFEGLFELIVADQELDMRMHKYNMYAAMVRNLLQALIERDKIYTAWENGRVVYHTK